MDSFKVTVDGYGVIDVPYPKSRKKKHYSDAIGAIVANVMQLVAKPEVKERFHPVFGLPTPTNYVENTEEPHRCMYRIVKPTSLNPVYLMKCECGKRYLLAWVDLVGRID